MKSLPQPCCSLVLLSAIVLLTACDSGNVFNSEPVTVKNGSSSQIAIPQVLRSVKAIDPEELILNVRVNDISTQLLQESADLWTGTVDVPSNQRSRVSVEWGMNYLASDGSSRLLKLAERERSRYIGLEETSIDIGGAEYITDFDFDNDARSNLEEIQEGRSPVSNFDVYINAQGSAVVGGDANPASAQCGTKIPIAVKSQVPASSEAGSPSTDHEAWWCAKLKADLTDADGVTRPIKNLELTVNVRDTYLYTDNTSRLYNDDSIELFIDGDDSKRGTYDGANDFQFRFIPDGLGTFSKANGPYLPANLNGVFDYYTGGYVLTATIPLNEVGIEMNRAFGINVQVNDDDDGGSRDGKFSWIEIEGRDIAYRNPEAFGTAQIGED